MTALAILGGAFLLFVVGAYIIFATRPSAMDARRFPKSIAALTGLHARFGESRGALEAVPIAVRWTPTGDSASGHEQVRIRATAAGRTKRFVLRSRGTEGEPSGVVSFGAAFTPEGRSMAEIESFLPESVRSTLAALAIEPKPAVRSPTPAPGSAYRALPQSSTMRARRNLELIVEGSEITLTVTAARISDDEMLQAMGAVARCARRAQNEPFRGGIEPRVIALAAASVAFAAYAVLNIISGGFTSGIEGRADVTALAIIGRTGTRHVISIRASEGTTHLDVPEEAVQQCLGSRVQRSPYSLTVHCNAYEFTDRHVLWAPFAAAAAVLFLLSATRMARSRGTRIQL